MRVIMIDGNVGDYNSRYESRIWPFLAFHLNLARLLQRTHNSSKNVFSLVGWVVFVGDVAVVRRISRPNIVGQRRFIAFWTMALVHCFTYAEYHVISWVSKTLISWYSDTEMCEV